MVSHSTAAGVAAAAPAVYMSITVLTCLCRWYADKNMQHKLEVDLGRCSIPLMLGLLLLLPRFGGGCVSRFPQFNPPPWTWKRNVLTSFKVRAKVQVLLKSISICCNKNDNGICGGILVP